MTPMIQYPVRLQNNSIVDSAGRVLDLNEIVAALNSRSAPRSRGKREKIEEQLKASDYLAQAAGREDVIYGHYDSLPAGEPVAHIRGRKLKSHVLNSMTPKELKKWREDRGLSQPQMAELLGVHWMTISKWEREAQPIPPFLELALKELARRVRVTKRA